MNVGTRLRRVGQLSMVLGAAAIALAVWGVVRAGQTLRAPEALPGRWRIDTEGSCAPKASHIALSQSGMYVRAVWAEGPGGTLEGVVGVDGHAELHNVTPPACGEAASLRGMWRPDRLDGTLTLLGCGECPPIPLTGQPEP